MTAPLEYATRVRIGGFSSYGAKRPGDTWREQIGGRTFDCRLAHDAQRIRGAGFTDPERTCTLHVREVR